MLAATDFRCLCDLSDDLVATYVQYRPFLRLLVVVNSYPYLSNSQNAVTQMADVERSLSHDVNRHACRQTRIIRQSFPSFCDRHNLTALVQTFITFRWSSICDSE